MQLTDMQVKRLLEHPTGQIGISQFSLSMAVTRYRLIYKKEQNLNTLKQCTAELNAMLAKYELIMQEDFELITSL
jgi:hypothetical protein